MSVFTPNEVAYLRGQRTGRLATVDAHGNPHVVPVGYLYNEALDTIDIAGWGMGGSKKLRDVRRDGRVAFVVDDVAGPRHPRGVEVRGRAEALDTGGREIRPGADPELIRVTPRHVASWGIDGEPYEPRGRDIE